MDRIKQLGVVGLLLVAAVASRGQDTKPPDYASKPLEYWIEALKNGEKPELRYQARQALGPDGPYAKVAVSALIDAFAHKKPPVGGDAVEALADFGPSIVPQLVRALKRPEAPVRAAVADALGYVEPKPVDAVPALLDAMKDSTPDVRSAAASSLGSIMRPLGKTVPALASALRDDQDEVREAAACALSSMGRKSRPALPALIKALKDKNWRVRASAAQALWKIGPDAKAAVPALIEGLRDKEKRSWTMAQALGGIGPEAKEAVPALIEAFQDKDEMIRRWATAALREIGPGAKEAVAALIAAAKDKGNSERDHAIAALGAIGPDAKAAVPTLMEALEKSEPYLGFRGTVARALGGIGPAAKEAVPALAAIARNQLDGGKAAYGPTRQAAAEAVMKIDPEFGAKHGIELAYLDVRLGKIPSVKLAPRAALTEEKKKHIKKLIADLAELADPDFGLSSTLTGHAFAPLPDQEHFGMGLLTNHRLKSSDALRSLVEIGPDALPFLLESLGDDTPTKLKIEPFGNTFLGSELSGNPLNALERRVLSEKKTREDDDDAEAPRVPKTLKVGDACFVAIGQIVGRPYSAVRYQPTAIVIINSSVESKELRERVRAIWSSDDPAQKLLDSLLIDYATEWISNDKSLDGWGEGSDWQIEAGMRLLYYFPKESAPLIAERLKRMDVSRPKPDNDTGMVHDLASGAYKTDFLKAITWCEEPKIRKALFEVFERTNDVQVTLALLAAVKETNEELIVPRLQAMVRKLPKSEDHERGDGYELLLALGQYAGKEAKPDFESYLRDGSLQRRWTMCWVLKKVHPEWALEFLTPMLTDKRTGFESEELRLCDMAAMTLRGIHSDLEFHFYGTPEELDRLIEQMRKQIAEKGGDKW